MPIGQSHQLPYPKSSSISQFPLDLIFSDVWGPAPESVGRNKFYVSFIDDYSEFVWIYLIWHKSKVFEKFHQFQQLVERLFNRKILALQTDWGGEYEKLNSFFKNIGISHYVPCPHAHQQNGVAERKQQLIVEVGLALLAHASMPLKFWDEAFLATACLINHTPNKFYNILRPLPPCSMKHHTTPCSVCLGVRVGQTFTPITPVNLRSGLSIVLSLGTTTCTKAINSLISLQGVFTSHTMLSLMRTCFHSLSFMLMQALDCEQKLTYYLLIFLPSILVLGVLQCIILM